MFNLFFGYLPFHGIISYIIIALPYALVMSYASRFSIVKTDKGFPLKLEDGGISEVSWKNAFCLIIAGCLSHFFIDQFFHPEYYMELWSSAYFNIHIDHPDVFFDLSGDVIHTISPLMFIGDIIVISTFILSIFFLRKGYKDAIKLFLIATVLAILSMLLISPLTYFGEKEYAVMILMGLYIFIPLFLLMYVARDIEDHPTKTLDVQKITRNKLYTIVAGLSAFFALFITLYASLAVFMPDFVAELYGDTSSEAIDSIRLFGTIYFIIALIMFVGSIGLFFKIKIFRYITIATSLYFIIFGFPFAIALFLCEKDVKEMFKRE